MISSSSSNSRTGPLPLWLRFYIARSGNTKADIEFSSSVRNLGVVFEKTMSFKRHISKVCQNAYYELRRISSNRHYLSPDATKILVCSLVLSRLDYGNALLAGSYEYLLDKLQKVQNNAARLIFKSSKKNHVTPLLRSLHWLPVRSRIKYKLSCISFSYFSGTGPSYLSEMLSRYSNLPCLCSSSDPKQFRVYFLFWIFLL